MWLERRLVAAADLVTSNTPEDCRKFMAGAAGTPVAFLPPGHGGPRVLARTIDARVPRRAVIVGSFDWPPKRISLERFLAEAAPVLARGNVELQIVGTVAADYLCSLRERYPSVTFIGPVDDVGPYMAAARLALVPDLLGGFKLKGLDYVFNRLPILSMRIALPGMPLQDGRSIGLFDSHASLAEGVVGLIDDFVELEPPAGARLRGLRRALRLATDRPAPASAYRSARFARSAPPVKARTGVPSSAIESGPVPAAGGR